MNQQTIPDFQIVFQSETLYPVATLIDGDHVYQITENAGRYTVYESSEGGWLEYENASANDDIFKVIVWLEDGGGKPI